MNKKYICFFMIWAIVISLSTRVYAKLELSAQSAILAEKNTGRILYEKNADKKMPVASTTKIMTAVVALEQEDIKLDDIIEISENASNVEGSSMYLQKGEKLTLKELLYGLMLSSGNDAAVAISEAISQNGEDFVKQMNDKAAEIGAKDTHFKNPNGLPDEDHYSTARNMMKITAYAMSNPAFREIVSTKSYKIEGEGKAYPRTIANHNKLLNMYKGCIGVKTGYTKEAGRCLVSAAERDGMTLLCVTLNASDDWNDHMSLYDYAYENYEYRRIVSKDIPVCKVKIKGSESEENNVYPGSDVHYPMEKGEGYTLETEIWQELSAPMKNGDQVGRIMLQMEGRNAEIPIVLHEDINVDYSGKYGGLTFAQSLSGMFLRWLGLTIE